MGRDPDEHGSCAVAFAKPKRQPVPLDLRDWSRVLTNVSKRRATLADWTISERLS
jgi:hypothetical protein